MGAYRAARRHRRADVLPPDSGLNEVAHEWLSWVLLGGVAHARRQLDGLHMARSSPAGGRNLPGLLVLLLAVVLRAVGGKKEPPFVGAAAR